MRSSFVNETPHVKNYDETYIEDDDSIVNLLNLLEAFKKIHQKNEMNEIDKKLMNFLDDKIKQALISLQVLEINGLKQHSEEDVDNIDEKKEDLIIKMKNYI